MQAIHFRIAIIGAGPAGLSAAHHAARLGITHVIIDRAPHIAATLHAYPPRKHVMAEPSRIAAHASLPFRAGTREQVLEEWLHEVDISGSPLCLGVALDGIERQGRIFRLVLRDREPLFADRVVLALGEAGPPRRLDVPGGNLPEVSYEGSDWHAWESREVLVVGAGDAAIEAALQLAGNNRVRLLNRGHDFPRARTLNAALLRRAEREGRIEVLRGSQLQSIGRGPAGRLEVTLTGHARALRADGIVVRIGATPVRSLLERCGIALRSDAPDALPVLSEQYETSVAGIFAIGGTAGCRLIKPCINQGHEVIEILTGQRAERRARSELRQRFEKVLPGSSADLLTRIRARAPIYRDLDDHALEALLGESRVLTPEEGSVIVNRDDHSDAFYVVLGGGVHVQPRSQDPWKALGVGSHFGELSLLSGRRRTATVVAGRGCLLVENPRLALIEHLRETPELEQRLDTSFLRITFTRLLGLEPEACALARMVAAAKREHYRPGEVIIRQGEAGEDLFVLRHGCVAVSRQEADTPVRTQAQLRAGDCFGEYALLGSAPRLATVSAATEVSVLRVPAAVVRDSLAGAPEARRALESLALGRAAALARLTHRNKRQDDRLGFLLEQGVGEATDAFVIDESLCIGCNECERACAATHAGVPRFQRAEGPSGAGLHLPTACRHCDQPHCMEDCPPGAISRGPDGHVVIDDSCIGCARCVAHCPYDAIRLVPADSSASPVASSGWDFWKTLLFGDAAAPGGCVASNGPQRAMKCDGCPGKEVPACVNACPTGTALRIGEAAIGELAERA